LDILTRGLCEHYIDLKLKESEIREVRDFIDSIELPLSTEDVLLGFFLGAASSQLKNYTMTVYNRVPEKAEIEHYRKILVRRAPEIVARLINLAPIDEWDTDIIEDENKDIIDEHQQTIVEDPSEIALETDESTISVIKLSPVATINDSDDSRKNIKFSFQSKSVQKPVASVLGIPIKK
jgi:hypothetical protein